MFGGKAKKEASVGLFELDVLCVFYAFQSKIKNI